MTQQRGWMDDAIDCSECGRAVFAASAVEGRCLRCEIARVQGLLRRLWYNIPIRNGIPNDVVAAVEGEIGQEARE